MPAGRPRAFSKEEALDRALDLFWTKGYEGASLSDLTAAMGINRPSLYAAFGDKRSLFRAAVDRYLQGPAAFVARALAQPTARSAVEHLLRDAADALTAPDHPPGCLAVHGALVCGADGDQAKADLAERRRASEGAIRERLERARAEGDLPCHYEPAALARYVATVFQGMAVQAAGGAPRAALREIAELSLSGLRWS